MKVRGVPVALVAALLGFACSSGGSVVDASGLTVMDPWIRTPPPFANTAALYTVIKNDSLAGDSLIAIDSPSCREFTLHRTTTDSGVASMAEITGDEMKVPAQGSLLLAPGGLHGMCLGLLGSLSDGDEVAVEMTFATAGPVQLLVPVERR